MCHANGSKTILWFNRVRWNRSLWPTMAAKHTWLIDGQRAASCIVSWWLPGIPQREKWFVLLWPRYLWLRTLTFSAIPTHIIRWWLFDASFIEITPLITEITRHAKKLLVLLWPCSLTSDLENFFSNGHSRDDTVLVASFHWNPSANYGHIASRGIGVKRQQPAWRTDCQTNNLKTWCSPTTIVRMPKKTSVNVDKNFAVFEYTWHSHLSRLQWSF